MSRVQGAFMMTYDESPDVIADGAQTRIPSRQGSDEEHAPRGDVRVAHHVARAQTVTQSRRFGIGEWYGRSFVSLTRDERRAYAAGSRFPAMPVSDGMEEHVRRQAASVRSGHTKTMTAWRSRHRVPKLA